MDTSLVLTVLGDDRPGLVEELAEVVAAGGGNWLESSLAQLAGKFAGIVRVSVGEDRAGQLVKALESFTALDVTVTVARGDSSSRYTRPLSMHLMGHDRPGIVREVAQVFARHNVNVEQLETRVSAAPMSSEVLFHADALLKASDQLDLAALQRDLESISNELFVDIDLVETA